MVLVVLDGVRVEQILLPELLVHPAPVQDPVLIDHIEQVYVHHDLVVLLDPRVRVRNDGDEHVQEHGVEEEGRKDEVDPPEVGPGALEVGIVVAHRDQVRHLERRPVAIQQRLLNIVFGIVVLEEKEVGVGESGHHDQVDNEEVGEVVGDFDDHPDEVARAPVESEEVDGPEPHQERGKRVQEPHRVVSILGLLEGEVPLL
mmetsp:Transcript_21729/g.20833  ORF Transcript_21729/g.20833 Transcript_21729/m.20833 type:complete len:201 (+) Transcript_21729:257-859(+)